MEGVSMSKIKCLACGAVLESKHINDFVGCGCRNHTFITGGDKEFRYGGLNSNKIKILEDPRLKFLRRPYVEK